MIDFVYNNAGLLLKYFPKYGIITPNRISHFLGQLAHESLNFTRVEENLNYSVELLLKKFGRDRISSADAKKYGRIDGVQKANKIAIANIIYGGSFGLKNLGNKYEGDGYKFRGRGYIQMTGRKNYEDFSKWSGIDVVSNPDLVLKPEIAFLASIWFWVIGNREKTNLNKYADKNLLTTITRIINGGTNGLTDRKEKTTYFKSQGITLDTLKKKNQESL